jgi:aerobic-type carbon monoxide dehydrogenase small subunit (CoxS/CutS family)
MSGRIDAAGERAVVEFTFAGRSVQGRAGDTIAMALFAAGEQVLRNSSRDGVPRGVLCNMGICYECLVVIDGRTVRACTTLVCEGLRVERGGKP